MIRIIIINILFSNHELGWSGPVLEIACRPWHDIASVVMPCFAAKPPKKKSKEILFSSSDDSIGAGFSLYSKIECWLADQPSTGKRRSYGTVSSIFCCWCQRVVAEEVRLLLHSVRPQWFVTFILPSSVYWIKTSNFAVNWFCKFLQAVLFVLFSYFWVCGFLNELYQYIFCSWSSQIELTG